MRDLRSSRLDFSREYVAVQCLYCIAYSEQAVADEINHLNHATAVVAAKWKKEWHRGAWREIRKIMLPGHVFLYWHSAPEPVEPADMSSLRVLQYNDGGTLLNGRDREFADWLWAQEGIVGISKAQRCEGGRLIFTGPLAQLGGVITKVDRRKQIAKITLDITGGASVWLSFDYVDASQYSSPRIGELTEDS